MNKLFFKVLIISALAFTGASCKNNAKKTTETSTSSGMDTSVPAPTTTTAPVVVAPDESLTTNVKDATKDFPGVNAAVSNGELTLTGTITRDKLPKLMMALNGLHPKKINNNLTIK